MCEISHWSGSLSSQAIMRPVRVYPCSYLAVYHALLSPQLIVLSLVQSRMQLQHRPLKLLLRERKP